MLKEGPPASSATWAELRAFLLCADCSRWFVVARSEAEAVTRCPFCGATD